MRITWCPFSKDTLRVRDNILNIPQNKYIEDGILFSVA